MKLQKDLRFTIDSARPCQWDVSCCCEKLKPRGEAASRRRCKKGKCRTFKTKNSMESTQQETKNSMESTPAGEDEQEDKECHRKPQAV